MANITKVTKCNRSISYSFIVNITSFINKKQKIFPFPSPHLSPPPSLLYNAYLPFKLILLNFYILFSPQHLNFHYFMRYNEIPFATQAAIRKTYYNSCAIHRPCTIYYTMYLHLYNVAILETKQNDLHCKKGQQNCVSMHVL